MRELAVSPEDRPDRAESERHEIARKYASHLPEAPPVVMSDQDIAAMRAAFIARFDEGLPRTETLMKVAMIGYRKALDDLQHTAGQSGR